MTDLEKIKNLDRDIINSFLREYLVQFKGFNGINTDVDTNINSAVFLTDNGEELLVEINSNISTAINNYIENKLNESCKLYNRSIIYYESEIQTSSLILRWI